MISLNKAISLLPPPDHKRVKVKAFQNTKDLTSAIAVSHKENLKYAKKLAPYFQGSNRYQTGRNIWNFLKTQVPYKVEPGSSQTTKTLPRMLNDAAKGLGSDCKHYAVFSGSLLQELKIPFTYRLAGYISNTPQHIYVVMKDGKREIPLDAVVGYYDYEKKPKALYDMALYKLSGTDTSEFSGFDGLGREYKRMGIETDQLGKIDLKKSVQKITQGAKTLGLAVPRNAFLLLIKFNAFGFASKIKKLIDKKGFDGIGFWMQLGGNRTDLIKAADEGAKKKAVLGSAKADYMMADNLGEPVTIGTALASAAPIIMKFKDVLKSAGITDDQIAAAASKATANFKQQTGQALNKVIFKAELGIQGSGAKITASNLQEPTEAEAEKVVKTTLVNSTGLMAETLNNVQGGSDQKATGTGITEWIKKNPIIALGVGFGAFYLLSPKK